MNEEARETMEKDGDLQTDGGMMSDEVIAPPGARQPTETEAVSLLHRAVLPYRFMRESLELGHGTSLLLAVRA